jgi:ParB-like chromosome segregation protein Spo0J
VKITHQQGDPKSLVLLEENARFMRHETFARLVENIKRDGVLQQWPFVWNDLDSGQRIVLSGNHRVRAAIDAGLEQIDWTECDEPLTRDQRVSIQLSHNAIAGEDDPTILKQLYESITDVEERLYAGLDDATLDLLAKVDTGPLSEVNLSYSTLLMTFLPSEYADAEKAMKEARGAVKPDTMWLARYDQHDRVLQAIEDARQAAHVMNSATAFDVLLSLWEKHREDFLEWWLDPETGEPRDGVNERDAVPVTSLTGMSMPAGAAANVAKALKKMKDSGQIEHGWEALDRWATTHLAK